MFTGIIEATGTVKAIETSGSNRHFDIESPISSELKVDQSVSHNGVCLTVTAVGENNHRVTAVEETLRKSSLGHLKPGAAVNLERCMKSDGRFDGHIVQGHVDSVGEVTRREERDGSWLFTFRFPAEFSKFMVEKGSVTINGISLTCFNVGRTEFTVTIIPYTYEHTTMKNLNPGDLVNLEFDVVGKYVQRILTLSGRL
ncbi:riboflavin synthase [Fulvivirga sedimenti]|uniref:Riboflavin synthase n=1 Tax=Fulvivirga sedimenti TaxID=2879465 RepID=A0A9X1HUX8_9BACT|nr:riboflavin synthase [Fulvivirga sedimenti]MCA6074957.1 riboflavin synthase [Fulvivirga sedimenti]MCA6076134.1 riboflavin synthase [Fulvivirga sedimenti]MCA6077262.1 riboflavin synthase [Fulvivirga sedimenti]